MPWTVNFLISGNQQNYNMYSVYNSQNKQNAKKYIRLVTYLLVVMPTELLYIVIDTCTHGVLKVVTVLVMLIATVLHLANLIVSCISIFNIACAPLLPHSYLDIMVKISIHARPGANNMTCAVSF